MDDHQVGHTHIVRTVCTTRDGKHVLSAAWDHTVIIWNLITGAPVRTLRGHTAGVYRVCITSDGNKVVTSGEDRTVRVFCFETGQLIYTLIGIFFFNCIFIFLILFLFIFDSF